ncbi:MAG: SRPBCC domain-containing protein [Actinomycetota bacterium]
MLAFESTSTISASPDAVWAVLVDGAAWPAWDSGVASVDGTVALGSRLKIQSKVAPGRTFPVKVTTFAAPNSLVFTGGMPFGLFTGVRTYTLTPKGTSTVFTMREEYTGPLSGSIGKSIPDLNPSFVQFANGLKARVESGA